MSTLKRGLKTNDTRGLSPDELDSMCMGGGGPWGVPRKMHGKGANIHRRERQQAILVQSAHRDASSRVLPPHIAGCWQTSHLHRLSPHLKSSSAQKWSLWHQSCVSASGCSSSFTLTGFHLLLPNWHFQSPSARSYPAFA